MNALRRLRTRLFLAFVLVALVAAAALIVSTSLIAPGFFDRHLGEMSGRGFGAQIGRQARSELDSAFTASLWPALGVALAVGVAVAALVAAIAARRIIRPLDGIRQATRRLAAGDYSHRVAVPAEAELAAVARDVNHLADALATTESRRTALLSDVAHELRTPLTTIEGHMEGLVDGVFSPEEVYATVTSETARMNRLIADIGLLSRADEGRLELHCENTDLGHITQIVVDHLRPQFDDKHVALGLDIHGALAVCVDTDRITQVLTNIIGNALRYTPDGGRVDVTAGRSKEHVRVTVTDTGHGLRPEDVAQVFERYYRVSSDGAVGGTGIGLTIARSLARAHGGDVTAASDGVGRGSTFSLLLPAATRA